MAGRPRSPADQSNMNFLSRPLLNTVPSSHVGIAGPQLSIGQPGDLLLKEAFPENKRELHLLNLPTDAFVSVYYIVNSLKLGSLSYP